MDEHAARDAVLARAIETTDERRETWSDADRMWASRTAASRVGEGAADDAFVGARAALVIERILTRHPGLRPVARRARDHRWLAPLAAAGAFVIGVVGVDIGPAHRINLLAPPVLALLAWNVAVYVALLVAAGRRAATRNEPRVHGFEAMRTAPGPLRRAVAAWFRDARALPKKAVPPSLGAAVARFAADWPLLVAPLWQQRAVRLMHLCAAVLAAGAIAGLYLRGIALEYRAAWQSTFLDATDVARLLNVVLAPGSWLTGVVVPDATHLQAIGAESAGENAAPWIHLYAATLLLVVIVPRLVLTALAWAAERRQQARFPLALGEPYFQRLLHAWREGTARIAAVAYSYAIPKPSAEALARLLMRAFESTVEVQWLPQAAYGEDDVPSLPPPPLAAAIVVFNLNATPERENHGAFAGALRAALTGRAPLTAIVDTSDFDARFGGTPRADERRHAWEQVLGDAGIAPLFVRLADPDVAAAAAMLTTRLSTMPA
ncbi:MAG TPA: DUF2868 domain-containing protein [Casimicrobiaceae bacterium]|nr:DUF2868 domain-containing protein [Casimicrobiaceae bacterium]